MSGPDLTVKRPSQRVEQWILKAAKELEKEGVRAIVGRCGFMIYFQEALSRAVNIPVFTSSLLLIPFVNKTIGNRRVGIVTAKKIDEETFGDGWYR